MPLPKVPIPSGPLTDEQICSYVVEVCTELRAATKRPRMRTINYLIDMTRLEAERTLRDLQKQG